MRVRMRKRPSASTLKRNSLKPTRLVSDVKKMMHMDKAREAFKTNARLCCRIAMGVLLAGVAQTHAPTESDRKWYFLPASYYLGGLSWAAMMVIFAASRNIGGAIQLIWQIDVGVAIALLYNFIVFSLIPMDQQDLIQLSVNFNGRDYYISMQDWSKIVPLLLVFTFIVLISPMESMVKKFAVSTNLYFMLTIVNPMNPIYPTERKDLGQGYFGASNLMKNLTVYCVVGVVGTLISLATMILPYPLFAIRELRHHIQHAPVDIREIMNLIVDAYCFRARDIREMDFFRLKLDRLMAASKARLRAMEALLNEAWWEEVVGGGWYFHFNKTITKQFVLLYGHVLKDLHAMKFAIELETCPDTHTFLMAKLQRNIYLVQIETNDLLDDISGKVLSASKQMEAPRFSHLDQNLTKLMKKFTKLYGELLANETVHTPSQVASSMPLNLFLYSFHTLVQTLCKFERTYNEKNYTTKHRVKNFLKHAVVAFLRKDSYPRTLVIFSLRTTLGVAIGVCFSTFVFAFSSTVPTAITMVAQHSMGGTYGGTANRLSGLVAGTVVPSIFSFFICKSSSTVVYNLLNNIALCLWTMLSMYVFYSGSYIKSAGTVSAFMASSVLLEHSCRADTGFKALSYSSLTENTLGILILMVLELVLQPRSARTLLRANIRTFLNDYGVCFAKVYRHHLAVERGGDDSGASIDDILDEKQTKELRKQLDGAFTKKLEEQAKLLRDASLEPDLWRPVFSTDKFTQALEACENLLTHLRILVDLMDWHQRRRGTGVDLKLRQNPATGSISMEAKQIIDAQRAWHASQDEYASAVSEALETLGMLFDEKFSHADAEDNALFMQMKEAFRLADVDRSGEVDPQELATLLDKLIPVAARGNIRMDQYVAEFMRLVDRNHDGKVSYAEFMDALNNGFRLELEIYEDRRGGPRAVFRPQSNESQLKQDHHDDESTVMTATTSEPYVSGGRAHRRTASDTAGPLSTMSRLWAAPAELLRGLPIFGVEDNYVEAPSTPPERDSPPLYGGGSLKHAMDAALLNVESFSIKDAAHRLSYTYGKCLLLQTAEQHVAVEDFIVMSCLICAADEIAARLTKLNALAAT